MDSQGIHIHSGASSLAKQGLLWKGSFDIIIQHKTTFSTDVFRLETDWWIDMLDMLNIYDIQYISQYGDVAKVLYRL